MPRPAVTRVLRQVRSTREGLTRARHPAAHRELARVKADQRTVWARQAGEAVRIDGLLAPHDAPERRSELWRRYERELRAALLPVPPLDLLRHPTVQETMLVRGRRVLRAELAFLRATTAPEDLALLLEEDLAGGPTLGVRQPPTSSTVVHHAHHLRRHAATTGHDPTRSGTVVEWGGGYGGFARTLRRAARDRPPAHVIVDLPTVLVLQWTFLTTVFGPDAVDLATAPGHRPRPGVITLVPDALADTLDVEADLFVSLWALSETPSAGQDAVAAGGFFGADRLLLAYQRSNPDVPDAERVVALVRAAGGTVEPLPGPGGHWYGFR